MARLAAIVTTCYVMYLQLLDCGTLEGNKSSQSSKLVTDRLRISWFTVPTSSCGLEAPSRLVLAEYMLLSLTSHAGGRLIPLLSQTETYTQTGSWC